MLSLLLFTSVCIAQKKNLTDTSYREWTTVEDGKISNDGKYVSYRIQNKPYGSSTRVLISTDRRWKKELINSKDVQFSADSRYVFYQIGDILYQLSLGTKVIFTMPQCKRYQLIEHNKREWLIYQRSNNIEQTIVKDLKNDQLKEFPACIDVYPNAAYSSIILYSVEGEKHVLRWLDLITQKLQMIYSGMSPEQIIFDSSGLQMAFRTIEKDSINTLWYYTYGASLCKKVCDDGTNGILKNHKIATNTNWSFSADSHQLYFTQDTVVMNAMRPNNPIISDYRDAYLVRIYNAVKNRLLSGRNLSTINLNTLKINQLLHGPEKIELNPSNTNDVFVYFRLIDDVNLNKRFEPEERMNYYVCISKTGQKISLKVNAKFPFIYSISPNGKHVVFKSDYESPIRSLSTETYTWQDLNMSKEFGTYIFNSTTQIAQPKFLGWDESGRFFLIQDQFDIWSIDAEDKLMPENLTKGKGEENRILYYPTNGNTCNIYSKHRDIYIVGFNINTKKSSLNILNISKQRFRHLIDLDSKLSDPYFDVAESKFCKSRDSESYLLLLENAASSPNYYFTKDFKNLIAISDEHPESKYEWLNAVPIFYSDSSGQRYQGILYRPEKFDSSRKYPVIFQYYGYLSNNLFEYVSPRPVSANINIPLMVSSGYLVVCPDIMLTKNKTMGMSALISLNAAADYMIATQFIDSNRLGLVGHSVGGFETNFIITHSQRFAAALSAAGVSNMVQTVNEVYPESGGSRENYVKLAYGFGAGLDSLTSAYVSNSPILLAKRINTPLLLVHNDKDGGVDVSHTIQFFNQLRALRKPVWWLNYSGEPHVILKMENRLDYQQRTKGFFDHFLMYKSTPDWMCRPITFD
jgi:dipeptidyl aminopeptidase/acylaminoacyl peptidase